MIDADRKQFMPVYGHQTPGKQAIGFKELTLPDGMFVPVGRGTTHAAYVPREDDDLLLAYKRVDRGFWLKLLDALVDAGAVTRSTAIDSTYVKAQRAAFGAKGGARARQLAARAAAGRPSLS